MRKEQRYNPCLYIKTFLRLVLIVGFLFPNHAKSEADHLSKGGAFEIDLGDREIPLTTKQDREQKLLEEQIKKK